jgi:hypothetical protein
MPSGRGRKRRRQATSLGAAAGVSRPHRAVRYRLSFDYGWAVVEEYQLNYGTPAASSRAIAAHFVAQGVKLSKTFVQDTLRRWRRRGDPTQLRTGGCTARRANDAERRWMTGITPNRFAAPTNQRFEKTPFFAGALFRRFRDFHKIQTVCRLKARGRRDYSNY